MVKPTYKLEVDWNNNGVFTDTGEDVSSRVATLEWRRGRDFASQLTGRSIAGKLVAMLDNASQDYCSFNTSSPLSPNVLPGRKVQLSLNGAVKWTGFLERINPIPSLRGSKRAKLVAWGPLGYLNQEFVELAMQTNIKTGAAINAVLDEVGWPAGDRDIDTSLTTMTRFWLDRQPTLAGLRIIERTENGFLRETKDGKIRFEDRQRRLKSPHTVSQATFSDANGAALGYSDPFQLDPLEFIFNEFSVDVQLYTVGALGVLWTLPESSSSSPANSPLIASGETRTFYARYPTHASPVEAFAVDAWTTPVATTDYLGNTRSDGTGLDRTSDLALVVAKKATTMQIDVSNNGTGAVFLTKLQARGTRVDRDDPVKIASIDTASQTLYGQRHFPLIEHFIPDTGEAQEWCDYNGSIYASPIPILEIKVHANIDQNHLDEILNRDISDRITLVANGVGTGLGINEEFVIESEHHIVDEKQVHTAIYKLSPARGFSGFWILGTSQLTSESVLAY